MNHLTIKLNNGARVAAKMYKGQPYALHYTNRTQALRKQQELGAEWEIRHWGIPFFVVRCHTDNCGHTGAARGPSCVLTCACWCHEPKE